MKDVYKGPERTRLRAMRAVAAAALALAAGCSSTSSAQAPNSRPAATSARPAPSPAATITGYDVSWPQCGKPLPKDAAFGIIGLNKYIGDDFNPCFGAEMSWAKKLRGTNGMPGFSVYVHIENPGAKLAKHWPTSGETPYGNCAGKTDPACSFVYGENLAKDDLKVLRTYKVGNVLLFEDVEEGYSWQNTNHTQDNVAAMEGMATAFQGAGDTVGIYSNALPWDHIAGNLPATSMLRHLPVWVLGAQNRAEAEANCASNTFAGGVILAQMAGKDFPVDRDLVCA